MKKFLALLLTLVCIGSISVLAADALAPAESVKADVDKVKFTHKEWTGTDYTDVDGNAVTGEDVFGINREDASVPKIPYQSVSAANAAVWDYNARENSVYFELLTGEGKPWDVTVVQNQSEAEKFMGENGFMTASFVKNDADGWKSATLPISWTRLGFDFSIYTNVNMPWQSAYDTGVSTPEAPVNYNPVGLYRKTFTVSDTMRADNRRIYISFQGVESAYYVYVNGKEVGYSEDSYSPHRFDVTDYLVSGDNLLAVKVHKFCDGTWFEDQDMIYDGGIFRDVYLVSEPLVKIEDYTVVTDLDENYENATLNLSVDVKNMASTDVSGLSIKAAVIEESGNVFAEGTFDVTSVASANVGTFSAEIPVAAPELWSAEKPNLYALVLTLVDAEGNEVESLSTQLGFRELAFTATEVDDSYNVTTKKWTPVTINGERLFIKGVNRHDSDIFYGKALTQSTMLEDVKLMKQFNVNAVRTSHYSNDEYFYWLCNKYGLYMMAETNMECHAIISESDKMALFYELGMDRTKTAFERLKNNPAIVMWSIGNEMLYMAQPEPDFAGGLIRDMVWFFKNNDKTRLVHAHGLYQHLGVDMYSFMYPSIYQIQANAGSGRIPVISCETEHAMGNTIGNFDKYWDAYRSADNMLGGFIWDWVDQARAVDLETVGEKYIVTDKTGVEGIAYGTADDWNTAEVDDALTDASFEGFALFQDAKFNRELSGTGKSFTFEVIAKPTSSDKENVIMTKGDHQVALKMRSATSLEFFVYTGEEYHALGCNLPENWIGNWHQIVGIYDKGVMSIWIDGVRYRLYTYDDCDIPRSPYPIGVGYDSLKNRFFDGEIAIARIYTKALSEAEIKGQYSKAPAITPDDECVLFWQDFGDGYTDVAPLWDYYAEDFAHQNMYADEMAGKFFGYGGDFGDESANGSFCQNGVLSADRNPQPELYEAKYLYQSFWFDATYNDIAKGNISVYNEYGFTNLNEYEIIWTLTENGTVIDSGTVENLDVKPFDTVTFNVPYTMPENIDTNGEYFLNFSVRTKSATDLVAAGHEIAWKQLAVPVKTEKTVAPIIDKTVTVTETENTYKVIGENFSFDIRKADGIIENYIFGGETLMVEGFNPNFVRGWHENDRQHYDFDWFDVEKNIKVESINIAENGEGLTEITVDITFPEAGNTKETIVYTVNGDGAITVDMTVDATESGMGGFLRVGSYATLPAGFEKMTWYGNGPVETLADRKNNARVGIWENTVSEFFYPYENVNESTLTDVVWMKLTNDKLDNALVVVAKEDVETNAMHFTTDDINAATHPYMLTPRDETIISVNYGSLGTGEYRYGPIHEYRLPTDTVYNWTFTVMPIAADTDDADVYSEVGGYHTAKSYIVDDIKDASVNGLDTELPTTAEYVVGEHSDTLAVKGYFGVNDPEMVITKAMTNGNAFTVTSRVFIPSEIFNNDSGSFDGTVKHNIIASLGYDTLSIGVRTPNGSSTWYLDARVGNGNKTYLTTSAALDASLTDKWHDVAVTYSGTTVTVYFDGAQIAENTAVTGSIASSGYSLFVGYDPVKTLRKSELTVENMIVYNEALSANDLTKAHKAIDDNVLLWMDFGGSGEEYMYRGAAVNALYTLGIIDSTDNFTDVLLADDAKSIIKNLTACESTEFASNTVSESEFITELLYALGYSDFTDAYVLAKELGLVVSESGDDFTQYDALLICKNALDVKNSDGEMVSEKLVSIGVVSERTLELARRIAGGETIVVACVGDSITYGAGATDKDVYSYPARLQKLLGEGFKVVNCGRSSSYVMNRGTDSETLWYPNTAAYRTLMSSSPDIVIVMLGTNDARAMTEMSAEDSFVADYKKLIADIASLESNPEIYLSTMIPAVNADITHQGTYYTLPVLIRNIANELGLPLVDTSKTLAAYYYAMLPYGDSVHPTDASYPALATNFYNEVFGYDKELPLIEAASGKVVYVSNSGSYDASGASPEEAVDSLGIAALKLANTGGTVVICGELDVEKRVHLPEVEGEILFTSVYDGVDYRTQGAKLIVNNYIILSSDIAFDNIHIECPSSGMMMNCGYNNLTVGEGTVCSGDYAITINVGYRVANATITPETISCHEDCVVKIAGGKWEYLRGGNQRTYPYNQFGTVDSGVKLSIYISGGEFIGTSTTNITSLTGMNSIDGDVYMEISGGKFAGDVAAICRAGSNTTGTTPSVNGNVTMKVVGGEFGGEVKLYQNDDSTRVTGTSTLIVGSNMLSAVTEDGFDKVEIIYVAEMLGDANGDKKVNLLDVVRILRGIIDETVEVNLLNADFDGNGEITIYDAIYLLKRISQG